MNILLRPGGLSPKTDGAMEDEPEQEALFYIEGPERARLRVDAPNSKLPALVEVPVCSMEKAARDSARLPPIPDTGSH